MSDNYNGSVKYLVLEPQYTQAERRRAESSEAYKEGYEQAVEKACMDANEYWWTIGTIHYKDKQRSPDLPDFEQFYDEDTDEWELSEEDEEWLEEFWDGWDDAHTKHFNKVITELKV
jgi:hypothetical protein